MAQLSLEGNRVRARRRTSQGPEGDDPCMDGEATASATGPALARISDSPVDSRLAGRRGLGGGPELADPLNVRATHMTQHRNEVRRERPDGGC